MPATVFKLAGVVLITQEGPSFGTPVFTAGDHDAFFIQSSLTEERVEEFVRLPLRSSWMKNFTELRANRSYVAGAPFVFGFKDREERITVDEKSVLQSKLHDEFDRYGELPFLSFSIARFIGDRELATRVINLKSIEAAIRNGELIRPQFFDLSEDVQDPDIYSSTVKFPNAWPARAEKMADPGNPLAAQINRLRSFFDDQSED